MESVDRLVWAAGFSFNVLGFEAGLRVNDPAVLEQALACLPPGWEPRQAELVERLYSLRIPAPDPTRGRRHYNLCYADHVLVSRSLSLEETLQSFQAQVVRDVAEGATERLMVQGEVLVRGSSSILLVGPGGATLASGLVQAGARSYTSDFALFDERGRLRQDGAGRPRMPSLVVIPAPTRPRTLPGARGVLELIPHTPSARRRPERALQVLSRALGSAQVWKGSWGEPEAILRLLSRSSSSASMRQISRSSSSRSSSSSISRS